MRESRARAVDLGGPQGRRPSTFWSTPRSAISRSCSASSGSRLDAPALAVARLRLLAVGCSRVSPLGGLAGRSLHLRVSGGNFLGRSRARGRELSSPSIPGTRRRQPRGRRLREPMRSGRSAPVTIRRRREPQMGNIDEAKGRAKQAVGDLTDDDDLRREGKVDEKVRPGQGQARRPEGQGRGHDRQGQGQAEVATVPDVSTRRGRHASWSGRHRRGVPVTHDHGLEVPFADRDAAGTALGPVLRRPSGAHDRRSGRRRAPARRRPRRGAAIARAIDAPLDVIIVRKLGVPGRPELAMGALGEGGIACARARCAARLARVRRAARGGRGPGAGASSHGAPSACGPGVRECRCRIGR